MSKEGGREGGREGEGGGGSEFWSSFHISWPVVEIQGWGGWRDGEGKREGREGGRGESLYGY